MQYSLQNKRQKDMTATPSKYPQGYFKDKSCKWCKTTFKPKAPSHKYCSQPCADYALEEGYLKRCYNLTKQQWLELHESQNGLCAICKTEGFLLDVKHKVKIVVDHCHTTGKVRGLLCHNCNRALGLLKDNVEYLKTAINYLEGATTNNINNAIAYGVNDE